MSSRTSNIIMTADENLTIDPLRGTFTLRFPANYKSAGEVVGLKNLSIYYSWDNLTATFNNIGGCAYIWQGATFPIVFPEGFYTISQLNEYIQFSMKVNGHYLINASGEEVYFISIVTNDVIYGVTATLTPIPASLPAGWLNPANVILGEVSTPQLVVSSTTRWGQLIGFAAGTYPAVPSTTQMQYNSSKVPQISPITNVLVACNWVNDGRFSNKPSVIASFIPSVGVGQLIDFSPSVITFYDITPKNYDGVTIQLLDQNYSPLRVKDYSQTMITLLVQSRA